MWRRVLQSAVLLCIGAGAAFAQLPPPDSGVRRGPGAAPELPTIEPKAPPPATITAPAAPTAPASEAPALSTAPIFVLRAIRVEGNTKIPAAAIDAIVAPYVGKKVSIADLEEIRRKLTVAYIDKGYLNSGVTIPDQNIADGIVLYRAVEGRVTEVEISGTEHFEPD